HRSRGRGLHADRRRHRAHGRDQRRVHCLRRRRQPPGLHGRAVDHGLRSADHARGPGVGARRAREHGPELYGERDGRTRRESRGATLSGTTTIAAANGVATFTGLSLDKTGTGYTLTTAAGGLT